MNHWRLKEAYYSSLAGYNKTDKPFDENNLVTEDAKIIIQDFLDFVSDKFSVLNPYDKLGLCKGDDFLLTQRCISIMEDSKLGKVDYHRAGKTY